MQTRPKAIEKKNLLKECECKVAMTWNEKEASSQPNEGQADMVLRKEIRYIEDRGRSLNSIFVSTFDPSQTQH